MLDKILNDLLAEALTPRVKTGAALLDFMKENPATSTGIGAGLLGGGMTAMQKRRPGESRTAKTMRVLRNALLAGGLGAGAVGAVNYGKDKLTNALPATDVDPVTQVSNSPLVRGGFGTLGLGLGLWGSKGKDPTKAISSILGDFKPSVDAELANPGTATRAAQTAGKTDISNLSKKVLQGMPGITGGGAGARGNALKQLFEGAGVSNIQTTFDELGTNPATRKEMLRTMLRAGINPVETGGGLGQKFNRNVATPARMWAMNSLTPRRIIGGGAGLAAGLLAPDIARGLANYMGGSGGE